MAKAKLITCEILTTIKGLDPKKPGELIYPGTTDKPALVDLEDVLDTRELIESGAIRIWPGPTAAPAAPLSTKDLKSLAKAEEALIAILARIEKSLAAPDLQEEERTSLEADKTDVEADLTKVREALK